MSRSSRAFRLVVGSAVVVSGAVGVAYALKHRPPFDRHFDRIGWTNLPAVERDDDLARTVARARDLMVRFKEQVGTPGIAVAVSVDGKTVWAEGAGLADVENGVPCTPDTVMRIASISKSVAMTLVARQWEAGRLDMDRPVQHYVPGFPEKTVDGEKVTVTPRLLANHLSGVRHYAKRGDTPPKGEESHDGDTAEFYLTQRCDTVAEAMAVFQDDELIHKPGSKFLYSTHGWTLLSAVCEAASGKPFSRQLTQLFQELGMRSTFLDHHRQILPGRARGYVRRKGGRLENAAHADVSCKWAGGGVASTARDLLRFAHATRDARLVSTATLREMWTPHPLAQKAVSARGRNAGYGLGWMVVPAIPAQGSEPAPAQGSQPAPAQVPRAGHSGGAVGASSELLISPTVAVAAIVNLQGVSLHPLVSELMLMFEAHAEHKPDWDWNRND